MRTSPRIGAIAAIAAVLLTAGCSTVADSDPAPTRTRSSPTPRPAPTPTAPTLDQLTVTPDGISADEIVLVRVGEPVPAAGSDPSTGIVRWNPTLCAEDSGGWEDVMSGSGGSDSPSIVVLNDASGSSPTTASDPVFLVNIVSDRVNTDRGIHLGSSPEELAAAYPEGFARQKSDGPAPTVGYAVDGESGTLSFEVGPPFDGSDGPDAVRSMLLIGRGEGPFRLWGTDGGYPCV